MRSFEEMKKIIGNMENTDYAVPDGIDLDGLIADMLEYVGTVDSDLREGIYMTFCELHEEKEAFSAEQIRHILLTAVSGRYLFHGIGESGTDSVFMRAFSSLLICVALNRYEDEPYLTDAELAHVKNEILRYMAEEKDYRGYVPGKGWAHAIAHGADMLSNIVFCVDGQGVLEALDAMTDVISNKHVVYTALEDERLADATVGAIYASTCERQVLTATKICDWLKKIGAMVERKAMPDDYNINANRKSFIKSLYVKLLLDDDFDDYKEVYDEIHGCVHAILKEIYE